MTLLRLAGEFFCIGLFSVGGGMATVPFLLSLGQRTGWFLPSALTNIIAISEATPGPIGVNMATYVGYTVSGVLGGIFRFLAEEHSVLFLVILMKDRKSVV